MEKEGKLKEYKGKMMEKRDKYQKTHLKVCGHTLLYNHKKITGEKNYF